MLTQAQFDALTNVSGQDLVSIYIPTTPVGSEQKDRIRLKNAIQQAQNALEDKGVTQQDARVYLTKGTNLTDEFNFSEDSKNGLAVFISADDMQVYPLETTPQESVSVGNSFKLLPLVKELNGKEGEFFLLSLSQSGCQLFVARNGGLDAIQGTERMAKDVDEALLLDDPNAQLNSTGRTNNAGDGTLHGYGAGKDTDNEHLKAYFDIIDRDVSELLRNETRPLLLAGVTELIPVYKAANQYTHLIEDRFVSGNVSDVPTTELYEQAVTTLGDYFDQQRSRDLELYGLNLAKGEAGAELKNILPAAINGRVAVLWVAEGASQYGHYEAATNGVEFTAADAEGAVELYDHAVVKARQNGARVYVVDADDLPADGSQVCAIYRYTVPAVLTNLG